MCAQVAQSCRLQAMRATIGRAAEGADAHDFAIVGVDEAVPALRCAFPSLFRLHLSFRHLSVLPPFHDYSAKAAQLQSASVPRGPCSRACLVSGACKATGAL
jgi:hypothetical protein